MALFAAVALGAPAAAPTDTFESSTTTATHEAVMFTVPPKPCQFRKDAAGSLARALDAVKSCAASFGKSTASLTMCRRS